MDRGKNIAQGAWVTVIDPKEAAPRKLRVAAYARVSTDSEDQINSYIAQVDFYTRYIREHTGWELVDVYADEGLSGMETQHREEFNRMIADCRDGKIDRILVKSISRFARNQADFILHMRELLRLGVSIHFEKENLDTGKMSSEMVADIYGAFAQMESSSHSKNMRVSYRIQMEKGIFVPAKAPYGYRLENRELHIVPEEAEIVRYIFREYLAGRGKLDISRELTERGVPRKGGEAWHVDTVGYILSNVTYTGDQIWHKTYKTDVLPYQKKRNKGQKPRYYAEACCPAIISRVDFEAVQALAGKRKAQAAAAPGQEHLLTKRVYCGECGSVCRRKNYGDHVYWICRRHDQGKADCPARRIEEEVLKEMIWKAYHKLRASREQILQPLLVQLRQLQERRLRNNRKITDIDAEIAKLTEQDLVLTRLKSKGYLDPALYLSERNALDAKVTELRKLRRSILADAPEESVICKTEEMLEYLESGPDWPEGQGEDVFVHLFEKVYLSAENHIQLRLRNGLEITEELPGRKE